MSNNDFVFGGFYNPKENWSRLPHEFIENLHHIDSLSEVKVILYLLRHTWGFSEFGSLKKITMDEFANGRKRRDGSRLDKGTGMSEPSLRAGLESAIAHGFIVAHTDDTDKGRIKKYYALNMKIETHELDIDSQGERILPPDLNNLTVNTKESLPRTEKETLVKKPKDKKLSNAYLSNEDKKAIADSKVKGFVEKYKYQILFTAKEGMLELADLCVEYFGKPTKSEAYKIIETVFNMLENGVIPADVIKAKEISDKWEHKPNSPHNAFLREVNKCALERINAKSAKNSNANTDFPKIENGRIVQ